MSVDLLLNATVIAAIITAGGGIGYFFLKRHYEIKQKRDEKKEESYRQLRESLVGLSDRAGQVTLKMAFDTDEAIQKWSYAEGKSEVYKSVEKEHKALHQALEDLHTISLGINDPIPDEMWKNIKQLKEALMNKLG